MSMLPYWRRYYWDHGLEIKQERFDMAQEGVKKAYKNFDYMYLMDKSMPSRAC